MRATRAVRTLLALLVLSSAPSVLSGQSGSIRNAVFVHGFGDEGGWNSTILSLWATHNYTFDWDAPGIPYYFPSTAWYSQITPRMHADSSILVGHSLGGMASRDATRFVDAAGLVSVGSGHTGIPIAAGGPSGLALINAVTYDATNVFQWLIAEAFDFFWQDAVWYAVEMVDVWGYTLTDWIGNWGMGFLATLGPPNYQTDLPPNSSFINQLPTNIPNSHTLSVTMYPGFNGGPIALHPYYTQQEADEIGENMASVGYELMGIAFQLQFQIDWEHEYADLAYDAVISLANIGADLVNFPLYWCGLVTSSHVLGQCEPHDGLVPTSRQTFAGASDEDILNGPAHTKETTHPILIDEVGNRLCVISNEC